MAISLRSATLVSLAVLVAACAACKGDRGPAGPPGTGGSAAVPDPTAANLNLAITAGRLTSDRKVQVDYTLTDPAGAGIASAADVTASWTLATLGTDPDSGLAAWKALLTRSVSGAKGQASQPTSETNGTTENLGGGQYRYTYANPLPADADAGSTYRVGVYARRPIPNTSGLMDVANGILDFVPNGGAPKQHDLVSTQACNACHTTLRAHGGFRRETRLCATCHTTQLVDPDTNDTGDPTQLNPLDFGRMVHRIHRGEGLPTVAAANAAHDTGWAYHVIGFGNSDNVYGAVVKNPNPAATATTVTAGVAFPRDIRGCGVCHSPAKDAAGNVLYGGQANEWQTSVSRRTCTSCHDSSWFANNSPPQYHVMHQQATNPDVAAGTNPTTPAYTKPAGLAQNDDSQCKTCHSQTLMVQHHTSPYASPDLNPLTLKIDSVKVTTPPSSGAAGAATVTFTITNKDGTPVTNLSTLGSASLNVTGPTVPDFSGSSTDSNIVTVNLITPGNSTATGTPGQYTANANIPAGATGTWAAGLEARRPNVAITTNERRLGHTAPNAAFNEFGINPVSYFTVSGTGKATPRRQVVALENCNVCHETLSVHGGLRHEPQYCVMCHTPDNTDIARRPAGGATLDKLTERSIHLKPMIHSIHTGEELETQKPFLIYGFGGSTNFFDEVRFPSSRANCQLCHKGATYTLDSLPADALPTRAMQIGPATPSSDGTLPVAAPGLTATVQPITAACIACHDSPAAHAHAQAMTETPPGGAAPVETCRVCHAENRDMAVSRVHSQAASRSPE